MSADDAIRLEAALEEGWRCIEQGRFRPATEVLADLRRK
jgi:predicted transcriptional regulator